MGDDRVPGAFGRYAADERRLPLNGWWLALGVWYLGLVYVAVWNRRSKATWQRLDAYPLPLRIHLFTPFRKHWRSSIHADDLGWVNAFRGAVQRRTLFVVLPPLVIFSWLYTTTWMRIEHTLERRAWLVQEGDRLVAIQAERGFPSFLLTPSDHCEMPAVERSPAE